MNKLSLCVTNCDYIVKFLKHMSSIHVQSIIQIYQIVSEAAHTLISLNKTCNHHYRIYTNSKHKIKLLADIGLPMSITMKAGANHEC